MLRKTKTRLHILGHLSTVSDPGGSPPELFPECSTPDFGSSAARCAAVWRGLKKLLMLELRSTQITDAGCATLAAALNRGTLPALEEVICCVLFNFNSNW